MYDDLLLSSAAVCSLSVIFSDGMDAIEVEMR